MIEKVLLTPDAVKRYLEFAKEVGESLAGLGLNPSQIPDEQMQELADGRAEIFVILPDKNKTKISFPLEKEDWAWK